MDLMSLLSRAADATKPGTRDILPVGSLVLLVIALVAGGAPGKAPSFRRFVDWAGQLGAVGLALIVLAIIAASIFLQPIVTAVSAVIEGRVAWMPLRLAMHPFVLLTMARRRRTQDRYDALTKRLRDAAYLDPDQRAELSGLSDRLRRYPREGRVRLTQLGNILAAGEEDAGQPYGLDARVVLPRLEILVRDEPSKQVAARRDDLTFSTRFCATLLLSVVVSTALLAPHLLSWAVVVPGVALVLAVLAYRNAIAAAVAYAEALRMLFDLERKFLYVAMGVPLPARSRDEYETGRAITLALSSRIPIDLALHNESAE